ncbi:MULTISPECIES: hypothetical protein [Polaromonas]|uniref:EthD domain-containing protein n=1 Tax=Polaromonas aquatica TaxID=332657 RepID=A0ABW1U113_9BURK
MQAYIKMVGSNSLDGDHATLFRWYCDHVNMLMHYPELMRANLFRRLSGEESAAPDYVCLYEFPTAGDFLDYSGSDVRKAASRVREDGWGDRGIKVVQRSEYMRHSCREFGQVRTEPAPGLPLVYELHCLQLEGNSCMDTLRWVDACVQGARERHLVNAAWLNRPENIDGKAPASGEWLVMLEHPSAGKPAASAPALRWEAGGADDIQALAPRVRKMRWMANYEEICRWQR